MATAPPNRPARGFRKPVLALALSGVLCCALLLAISYLKPVFLESWARKAIAHEVQQSVGEQLGRLDNASLLRSAERLAGKNAAEIADAKEELERDLPARVAAITERMLDPSCPCRIQAAEARRDAVAWQASKLQRINMRLGELIAAKYHEVSSALLREVRIFSIANAAVFLMLAFTAWVWKGSPSGLIAPTIVLLGAAMVVAAGYLFSQNWLQTILLGDYVGLWYFPYLLIVFAFMFDLVFNRARVSRMVVASILAVVGAAASAVC